MRRWPVSVSEWVLGQGELARNAERLASLGYDGIELAGEPARTSASAIERELASSGLRVTSICGMYTPERDLANPDPVIRAAASEYVRRCLDVAGEVGAPVVIVVPAACDRVRPLADRDAELQWSAEAIAIAVEGLPPNGPRVALEALNRYETYLVTRLDQANALRRAIGSPAVALMADLFHMNIEEPSIAGSIRAHAREIIHVHVADSNRLQPGRGHIDFDLLFSTLVEIAYEGAVAMEFFPVTDDAARDGLRRLDEVISRL